MHNLSFYIGSTLWHSGFIAAAVLIGLTVRVALMVQPRTHSYWRLLFKTRRPQKLSN
jgi:hypothetical protein